MSVTLAPLPLDDYMLAAEAASDDYSRLVVAAANARADYEQARNQAMLRSRSSSVAGREVDGQLAATEQHRLWLIAEARANAAKTHVQVVLGLMVAAQSRQKWTGMQDGGGLAETWKPGW